MTEVERIACAALKWPLFHQKKPTALCLRSRGPEPLKDTHYLFLGTASKQRQEYLCHTRLRAFVLIAESMDEFGFRAAVLSRRGPPALHKLRNRRTRGTAAIGKPLSRKAAVLDASKHRQECLCHTNM